VISGIQDVKSKHKQNWINHLEKWTTPDSRNTPSTTNLEEEEIVDVLGNDGNASRCGSMLPHLHTIHNDIILLNVLTEV